MKLSVIIPAYNEEKTIAELISTVKKVDLGTIEKEIIVVDDGSKDKTREILRTTKDIKFIEHEKNLGKGGAVKTGINNSTGDIIIIQDADLEYNPHEYLLCIQPIIEKKTNVVYGSRFLSQKQKKNNLNFFKKHENAYRMAYFGGRLLTALANILYRANITDEATCYKTFDAQFLKSIKINGNRFEWEPEILAKVRKRKERIIEVPISYNPRTFEQGKKINWKDGLHAIWTLIKYRFVD